MVSVIDTNILLDIFLPDPVYGDSSLKLLEKISVNTISSNTDTLYMAGQLWLQYRKQQKGRDRIIPDFIIGAFAMYQWGRLITHNRGFYRDYFQGLKIN